MTGDGAGCRVCCLCPEGSCFTKKKHTLMHTHTHTGKHTQSERYKTCKTSVKQQQKQQKKNREGERKKSFSYVLLLLIEFFPVLSLPSLLLLLLVTGRCGEPMLGQHIRIRLALPPRTTPRSISSRESRNEKWETRLVSKCYTALHCCTLLTLLYTGCRQFSCYF